MPAMAMIRADAIKAAIPSPAPRRGGRSRGRPGAASGGGATGRGRGLKIASSSAATGSGAGCAAPDRESVAILTVISPHATRPGASGSPPGQRFLSHAALGLQKAISPIGSWDTPRAPSRAPPRSIRSRRCRRNPNCNADASPANRRASPPAGGAMPGAIRPRVESGGRGSGRSVRLRSSPADRSWADTAQVAIEREPPSLIDHRLPALPGRNRPLCHGWGPSFFA